MFSKHIRIIYFTKCSSPNRVSGIKQKIIAMYGRGLTTREISEQIEDIYGFEASAELISKVTGKILPQIEEWQQRTLSEVYPIRYS